MRRTELEELFHARRAIHVEKVATELIDDLKERKPIFERVATMLKVMGGPHATDGLTQAQIDAPLALLPHADPIAVSRLSRVGIYNTGDFLNRPDRNLVMATPGLGEYYFLKMSVSVVLGNSDPKVQQTAERPTSLPNALLHLIGR